MGKKKKRQNLDEDQFAEEDIFIDTRQGRKDKRRNRRHAKNKFDNAVLSAKFGNYEEFENVEYDDFEY